MRVRRATDRSSQTARGHLPVAEFTKSDTAAVRPNARAPYFSHPVFVALSIGSGCSFGHALEVLGAGGGRSYKDVRQGVQIVRLVSSGLPFEQPRLWRRTTSF